MRPERYVFCCVALVLLLGGLGCDIDDVDLVIISGSVPDGRVGLEFFFAIETDGDVDAFRIVSGEVPPGIRLSDDGILSGVPTMAGTFTFTVEAINVSQGLIEESTAKTFPMTIQP